MSNNIGNITQQHRQAVAWIIEAAEKKGLAMLEVTETASGKPAVLLVAISSEDDGKGARMAPLARLDLDFENDFTPPEGVETVVSPPAPEMETVICEDECADVCNHREEDDEGVDKAGVGC